MSREKSFHVPVPRFSAKDSTVCGSEMAGEPVFGQTHASAHRLTPVKASTIRSM